MSFASFLGLRSRGRTLTTRAQITRFAKTSTLLCLGLCAAVLAPSQARALPAYFNGTEQEFYTLPPASQIPTGGPGTVVRWQRFEPSVILTANADPVVAYRMLYKSTDDAGVSRLVSGSVLMPVRLHFNSGSRPIVAFATGTQGMADRCAAVHGISNSTNYDLAYMRPALDKGWAVAVSDYQGLGPTTPGDEHVQTVGRILGRNVLDAARTVAQFAGEFDDYRQAHWWWKPAIWANISAQSKVVIWGYSEGGQAAAWAAQLRPSYASDLNLVGVAAGGIPADLRAVATAMNNPAKLQNVAFGMAVATAIGYRQAYPTLTFETKLKGNGSRDAFGRCLGGDGVCMVTDIKNQCLFEQLATGFGFHTFGEYFKDNFNPLTDAGWIARFEQNKLGNLPPTVPAFLWHAKDDEGLEFCQARKLAKTYCAAGVQVSWTKYQGEHALGWTQGLVPSLDFLDARINGNATPGNCAVLANPDSDCPGQ